MTDFALALLEELRCETATSQSETFSIDAAFILSINRHAAKYLKFEKEKLHLPLIAHSVDISSRVKLNRYHRQSYESDIELLLDNGPEKVKIIGAITIWESLFSSDKGDLIKGRLSFRYTLNHTVMTV